MFTSGVKERKQCSQHNKALENKREQNKGNEKNLARNYS